MNYRFFLFRNFFHFLQIGEEMLRQSRSGVEFLEEKRIADCKDDTR